MNKLKADVLILSIQLTYIFCQSNPIFFFRRLVYSFCQNKALAVLSKDKKEYCIEES